MSRKWKSPSEETNTPQTTDTAQVEETSVTPEEQVVPQLNEESVSESEVQTEPQVQTEAVQEQEANLDSAWDSEAPEVEVEAQDSSNTGETEEAPEEVPHDPNLPTVTTPSNPPSMMTSSGTFQTERPFSLLLVNPMELQLELRKFDIGSQDTIEIFTKKMADRKTEAEIKDLFAKFEKERARIIQGRN